MTTRLLHCQSYGEGPRTSVLLHGLFGLSANLGSLARELSRTHRVLVPDLRNHGRSFHVPDMRYGVLAADVMHLLDAHGVERAALLGHSMGGKVAMQAALDHPQRVTRLLVADIAPVRYAGQHEALFAALREVAADVGADRRATKRLLDARISEAGVVSLMLMNRYQDDAGHWRWRFDLDAIEAAYEDILAAPRALQAYAGPTLFLKGEQSNYIDARAREATERLFPRARLKVIAGAGHWLHVEKPAIFLRLARDFLDVVA